jgi:TonB-dependent SusC/RagA subfamily outer membrane receptor
LIGKCQTGGQFFLAARPSRLKKAEQSVYAGVFIIVKTRPSSGLKPLDWFKKIKTMKHILIAVLAAAGFSLLSCAGPQRATRAEEGADSAFGQTVHTIQNPLSLADFLVRAPGVFVDERGPTTVVTIRGQAPLFVVDNMPVGRTYESAANAVSVNDIESVEVLKGAEAAIYGMRGGGGVIIIRTKS